MAIRISALVCTHNRAAYLRKAIESLAGQTLARDAYEVLVVDNASTDETRQVVKEFSSFQNLVYLQEPTLGVSHARNLGWRHARGEFVACLDDDAMASRQWLERIVNVFETVKPLPGCVGGKIEPIWERPQPRWLSGELATFLTIQDWSDYPTYLTTSDGSQWLAAANLAFPRALLERVGGFPTDLDRKGHKLLSMGETLVHRQLERMGYSCFYHPDIVVSHHVHASRLEQGWFVRRAFWEGVSEAIVALHMEPHSKSALMQKMILETAALMRSPRELANLVIPTQDPNRFAKKGPTLEKVGYLIGLSQVILGRNP